MTWINAKDKLPAAGKAVLAITDDGDWWIAFVATSSLKWKSAETHGYLLGVTHWQPLPTKPTEKEAT